MNSQNQLILHGGSTTNLGQPAAETWAYSCDARMWQLVDTPGVNPAARWRHSALWDGAYPGMIVYGGLTQNGPLTDSWFLLPAGAAGAPPARPVSRLRLALPSPNPASGRVRLEFEAPTSAGPVEVAVYDVLGRKLVTLWRATPDGTRRSLTWDGRDARGLRCASGIYFVRARTEGGASVTRKLVKI